MTQNDATASGICPACNAEQGQTRGRKNNFTILSCAICETLYTSSAEANAAPNYDDYYSLANLVVPEFIDRRLDEIVAGFEPYRKKNKLLDLGCGAGSLLLAARRANWQADGLDLSKAAIDHVRSEGFNAFCGELFDASYLSGEYDVVTASELLEHVLTPRRLVTEIARIIRPGGLLWMTTPNWRGLSGRLLKLRWSVVCPPEHLQLFSRCGLRTILTEGGFRSVRINSEGVNPFELMNGFQREKKMTDATDESALAPASNQQVNRGGCERVASSYQLNEALTSTRSRRAFKNMCNGLLRLTRLGDSLKVRAER